jgi:hypothetical protein
VEISSIISQVTANSLLKIRPDVIGDCAKFTLDLGPNTGYLDEIVSFHSSFVNPTESSVNVFWFSELGKSLGKAFPLTKVAAVCVQYSGPTKLQQMRPLPDICRNITSPELVAMSKDESKLKFIEGFMSDNRRLFEKSISAVMGQTTTRNLIREFEMNLVRYALSKALQENKYTKAKALGKFAEAKAEALRADWLRYVQGLHVDLTNIAKETGIDLGIEPAASSNLDEAAYPSTLSPRVLVTYDVHIIHGMPR